MLKEMLFSTALIGGSGSDVDVEELNVTENGEYYDGDNVAYSPVNVNVPQTTVTALTATENKVYTAPTGTAYSPVTVNVTDPNTTSYLLLDSQEYTVQTESTAVTSVGQIIVPIADSYVYVRIRDKSTVEDGCFYGSDAFGVAMSSGAHRIGVQTYKRVGNSFYTDIVGDGVYVSNMLPQSSTESKIYISARYNETRSGTIDSTYVVEVYSLASPDGVYPS